jgi:hypothetical protein
MCRAVAGGDDIDGIVFQSGQMLLNAGTEGHHDLGVVSFSCLVDMLAAHIHVGGGQVGAKQVAGEKDFGFGEIGEHRLRPVHPGGVDELQCLISQ